MKFLFGSLFLTLFVGYKVNAQIERNTETFTEIRQIDSSNIYFFENFISRKETSKYRLSYTRRGVDGDAIGRNNVWFYNLSSGKCSKIFKRQPVLIAPLIFITKDNSMFNYTNSSRGTFRYSGVLSNMIIYTVQNDGYNQDGLLTDDDGYSLFVSAKDGKSLTQITPSELNVEKWMISKDGKTIIATIQKDTNGDKSFTDEEDILYKMQKFILLGYLEPILSRIRLMNLKN